MASRARRKPVEPPAALTTPAGDRLAVARRLPASHFGSKRRWVRYANGTFYLFASPWIVGFLVLTAIPMIYALLLSLTNWDGISPKWHWVGLTNYVRLLHDSDVWFSLGRTLLYTGVIVPLTIAGGLGLALLLNRPLPGVGVFRTLFYLPAVVPVVASAIAWKLMFNRDTGAVNALLATLHLPSNTTWLVDPTAFYTLIVVVLWGVGGSMVLSLAGLQGIPPELREAALVDGASPWQTFRHVVLPLLSPVIFFQVVTGVIFALQTLVQPLLLTPNSGIGLDAISGATTLPRGNFFYMINVYIQFFYHQSFGYGSALLWALFAVILVATVLVFRTGALWVYYEGDREEGN